MNEPTGGGAWRSAAACAGLGPTLFYDPSPRSVRLAKAVCWRCEVITECAAHARATGEPFGIWGGQTEIERVTERGAVSRGPSPLIADTDLIEALESADPQVLAIEVVRRRFGLKPDAAYKCLVRALRLGLIERRGRNLYPARPR